MDDQTFESLDSSDLKPDEWVFSLATMTLGDSPHYYLMGTAYVAEAELEPSKVINPSCTHFWSIRNPIPCEGTRLL